jgi:hypothetical protein
VDCGRNKSSVPDSASYLPHELGARTNEWILPHKEAGASEPQNLHFNTCYNSLLRPDKVRSC